MIKNIIYCSFIELFAKYSFVVGADEISGKSKSIGKIAQKAITDIINK